MTGDALTFDGVLCPVTHGGSVKLKQILLVADIVTASNDRCSFPRLGRVQGGQDAFVLSVGFFNHGGLP